ncbi:MAG: hypothetical protein ACRCXL_11135 [Dermatophilaceae bacterium]
MPRGPEPARARAALACLEGLREVTAVGEDDVLACLVIAGEPAPQRTIDDWLDQVADTLRAIGETVDDLAPVLARHAADPSLPGSFAREPDDHQVHTGSQADTVS